MAELEEEGRRLQGRKRMRSVFSAEMFCIPSAKVKEVDVSGGLERGSGRTDEVLG